MTPTIRLIREVREPTGRGPGNGQFALQRALTARAPNWLQIGGPLRKGEVPWFWCWADAEAAALCARTGQPLTEPLKHNGELQNAQFSPDGQRVVTGSADKTARVWNVRTGQPLAKPLQHNSRVKSTRFTRQHWLSF